MKRQNEAVLLLKDCNKKAVVSLTVDGFDKVWWTCGGKKCEDCHMNKRYKELTGVSLVGMSRDNGLIYNKESFRYIDERM